MGGIYGLIQALYNIQNAMEMLEKYLKKVLLESVLDGPITASTKKSKDFAG